ncbi:alpha/beta fold hydrolase [Kineococcus radiotolerans]|uniref:Hydrolase protein n=1 Tax=Kineococcus radiotolerans (strain ATCC BAA-149 / DSM 14245 / SRS30216) TaxID=266940 RepID=A6W9J2_KINRD|nr:alpha/beta hydrolase [Kineococcus radiotolerans]ABS03481.1 putative hydrolase protein [Kineococcus radiotolerans SRS30216 = ATCC BAA-149]
MSENPTLPAATAPTAGAPTVVLVHGAFAESASWAEVAQTLSSHGLDVVAVANPLRSVAGDAAYLTDVVRGLGRPVVLVGHSYGGMVITQAADALGEQVRALVYVAAFVPERGESALELSGRHPGSTLGETLLAYPVATGGNEFRIDPARFAAQFAADVPAELAATMALTQRPVTEAALTEALSVEPAWKRLPSWAVYGDGDLNIPAAALASMAERAGVRGSTVVEGASHAVGVSHPDAVATAVLAAVAAAGSVTAGA